MILLFLNTPQTMKLLRGVHLQTSTSAEPPHLNSSMAAQVEVKLGRVRDGAVHCGPSWDITTLPNLHICGRQMLRLTLAAAVRRRT